MAETSIKRFYGEEEFVGLLPGFAIDETQVKLLGTILGALALSGPIAEVRRAVLGERISVVVEWAGLPSSADVALIDAAVAAFGGAPITDAPLSAESLGITSATTSALVTVIDATTPPRQAGAYRFDWCCLVGMLAAVANTGVRGVCTVTRTQGADVVTRTWEHNSTLQQPQTFSGGKTFNVAQGATIRVLLQVGKVGVPAATAQMAVASATVDKIG